MFRNYGTTGWFYKTVRCHSFWTPAVVLYHLRFSSITITLRSVANIEPRGGTNFRTQKFEFCIFFALNCCLTIITLLRGPKIIIWRHVKCTIPLRLTERPVLTSGRPDIFPWVMPLRLLPLWRADHTWRRSPGIELSSSPIASHNTRIFKGCRQPFNRPSKDILSPDLVKTTSHQT